MHSLDRLRRIHDEYSKLASVPTLSASVANAKALNSNYIVDILQSESYTVSTVKVFTSANNFHETLVFGFAFVIIMCTITRNISDDHFAIVFH